MSDVLRSTTFQLEFKGQDGITGVRQFTKAVTDADAVVDKLSETLGSNVDVTVKNIRSKAELVQQAKLLITQMEKTNSRVAEMTKLYELQTSMIGKTANEQEILNAVFRLGSNATQAQKDQITGLISTYQNLRDASNMIAQVNQLTSSYSQQLSMLGKTANEQELLNAVSKLGVNATQAQIAQVEQSVISYQKARDALALVNKATAEKAATDAKIANETARIDNVIAQTSATYAHQATLIGKTAKEQAILTAVFRLGASATQAQKDQMAALAAASYTAHGSFRNLRGISQQLGWQIQDVAVQAQMGTSAFVIIGQQGSQLAAAFGPTGALVGAVIAVASAIGGTLIGSLRSAGNEIDSFKTKVQDLEKYQRLVAKKEVSDELAKINKRIAEFGDNVEKTGVVGTGWNRTISWTTDGLNKQKAEYEGLISKQKKLKERLAELNGAPLKDTVKTFDNMTDGIKKNIIALREGEKAAALYSAQQEIMRNAKENKLSDDVVKQQIADVTALINEEYRLKDAKEAAKKSEQAAKKDRSAEQAVLKAQESEFDSLRKSMEKGTNTIKEEYDRRKSIIDRHVATVGSVDVEAAQAYGVLEEWKTEKLKDEYNKRETVRKSIENAQKTQAKKEDPTGSENALFEQNLKTLRDQKAQSGQLELAERQRIDSLMEAEVTRHTQRLNEISNTQLIATLENYATFTGSLGGVFKQMQSMAEEGSKEAAALFYINQAIALADTIVNTELAATKAMGQLGVFGIPASTLIRATGYASAGIIAGQTIAGAYDKGGVIPAGSTGIVSEYGDELVNGQLIKGPARVTSREDTAKLMNNGGTSLKVVVDNKISGASYSVQQIDESTVKLIAEQVFSNNIDSGVSGVLNNRNSKSTKAMKNKFTVRSKF